MLVVSFLDTKRSWHQSRNQASRRGPRYIVGACGPARRRHTERENGKKNVRSKGVEKSVVYQSNIYVTFAKHTVQHQQHPFCRRVIFRTSERYLSPSPQRYRDSKRVWASLRSVRKQ